MPLKSVVDDLETVPEALRGEYVEKDGKFHLNIEDIDNHPELAGLRSALSKERGSRGAAEKQAKAWQSLGKSPEEIAELLQKQADEEAERAKKSGDFDKILKQHLDKAAKDRADLEAELNAARASERSAVVGERLLGALTKAGVTEEGLALLPGPLSNRIKFETVDGKRILKIMQDDGETPMAGKGADGGATLDDLVAEAITKFPSSFKGEGRGGSGKQPGNQSGGSGNGAPSSWSDCKTDEQKVAFLKAKGQK